MNREKLLKYGIEVFNSEIDKFSNWLTKPNHSLGGKAPNSLLDTPQGIREVKNCLDRIEYGNFS
jgi:putative toxin-antitoxin system antitoxin component (TIGR02293 family)